MDDTKFPLLPEPFSYHRYEDVCGDEVGPPDAIFTATQMHAYAEQYHREACAKQAGVEPVCATCSGNGLIGGPSFYEPGEGGVPCPDCSPQPSASDGRVVELIEVLKKAYIGLRDWETPENRYAALRAIDAALAEHDAKPSANDVQKVCKP